jgi:hypothetical protein
MNDNYLWDRSGEPDPDVQQLEEILGTLRYQPRRLEIPANIRPGRRTLFSVLAIAATIALMVGAAGLWFNLRQRQPDQPLEAGNAPVERTPTAPLETQSPYPQNQAQAPMVGNPALPGSGPRHHEPKRTLTARTVYRYPVTPERRPEFTPAERAEKEQLIQALRLVSAKLNIAQRRAQGTPALNVIRNQHPMG